MNQVEIHYNETKVLGLNPEFFVLWYQDLVGSFSKRLGEINLIFCSDDYLLKKNQTVLKHDYYTDIITFDNCFLDVITGDLFISIDRVRDNAKNENTSFENELKRVCVHGVLHLCGLKDSTEVEKQEMRSKENFWLEKVPRETLML